MTSKKEYIMNDVQNKLNWLKLNTNHNIAYIAHQGSANYDMFIDNEQYKSDVDVKAICIPSFEDIVKGNKMFSHTYVMEDNSHIDVKDIRLYIDLWKKSNPSFLEILFSEFNIVCDERFNEILKMADDIAFANKDKIFSCIKGMQMEKYKALKHPYPTIKDKIDKYGYDPKQFHHLYRLLVFGKDICSGKSFRDSLVPNVKEKELCIQYKANPMPLNEVEELSLQYLVELKDVIDTYRNENILAVNEEVYEKLENIVYSIIANDCKKELLNDINKPV